MHCSFLQHKNVNFFPKAELLKACIAFAGATNHEGNAERHLLLGQWPMLANERRHHSLSNANEIFKPFSLT